MENVTKENKFGIEIYDYTGESYMPAMSFGKSGTFATQTPIEWIEKEYDLEGENLSQMWTHLYKDFREGIPYPITDEEALEVIRVIAMIKNNTKITKIKKSK